MQAQKQKRTTTRITRRTPLEYTAALRYLDGKSDLVRVRFADSIEEARQLVIDELGPLRSLVLAERTVGTT